MIAPAVLDVHEKPIPTLLPVQASGFSIAVGETAEPLDTGRRRVRAVGRTRQPDIVTVLLGGEVSARILSDVEIAGRIEREIVWHREISRRVDAYFHV